MRERARLMGLAVLLLATLAGGAAAAWYFLVREPEVTVLRVAAGPRLSDGYQLMGDFADVVARHAPHIRLELVETGSAEESAALVQARQRATDAPADAPENAGGARATDPEKVDQPPPRQPGAAAQAADLAIIRSDTVATRGLDLVATLWRDYFQLVAREDSGIRTMQDLRGRSVVLPPTGTAEFMNFWVAAGHHGLDVGDFRWRGLDTERAIRAMVTGEADAVFFVRSARNVTIRTLIEDMRRAGAGHVQFVPIPQAPALALKRPFIGAGTLVQGTYGTFGVGRATQQTDTPVPGEDIPTVTVDSYLVAGREVDAGLINDLTRVLFEQRADLTLRVALGAQVQAPEVKAGIALPLHAGADRYFSRDKPGFLEENANSIGLVLTVAAMGYSVLAWLRAQLLSGQKNRSDRFNKEVLVIARRARAARTWQEMRACRDEMDALFERVIEALDRDEVTEDGFESFALTWEAVRRRVSDGLTELREQRDAVAS
jgi:TRAP transporter TAXI family solute receptor